MNRARDSIHPIRHRDQPMTKSRPWTRIGSISKEFGTAIVVTHTPFPQRICSVERDAQKTPNTNSEAWQQTDALVPSVGPLACPVCVTALPALQLFYPQRDDQHLEIDSLRETPNRDSHGTTSAPATNSPTRLTVLYLRSSAEPLNAVS